MDTSLSFTRIAGGDCGRNDCPAVFVTGKGTLAVQGYDVVKETSSGESVVEIPMDVLREAVRALGW
jgi:hypothetical protein